MLEQTKSVEVQENETITLTCPVESTDESTQFEWSKHGMPVTQSSNLQVCQIPMKCVPECTSLDVE